MPLPQRQPDLHSWIGASLILTVITILAMAQFTILTISWLCCAGLLATAVFVCKGFVVMLLPLQDHAPSGPAGPTGNHNPGQQEQKEQQQPIQNDESEHPQEHQQPVQQHQQKGGQEDKCQEQCSSTGRVGAPLTAGPVTHKSPAGAQYDEFCSNSYPSTISSYRTSLCSSSTLSISVVECHSDRGVDTPITSAEQQYMQHPLRGTAQTLSEQAKQCPANKLHVPEKPVPKRPLRLKSMWTAAKRGVERVATHCRRRFARTAYTPAFHRMSRSQPGPVCEGLEEDAPAVLHELNVAQLQGAAASPDAPSSSRPSAIVVPAASLDVPPHTSVTSPAAGSVTSPLNNQTSNASSYAVSPSQLQPSWWLYDGFDEQELAELEELMRQQGLQPPQTPARPAYRTDGGLSFGRLQMPTAPRRTTTAPLRGTQSERPSTSSTQGVAHTRSLGQEQLSKLQIQGSGPAANSAEGMAPQEYIKMLEAYVTQLKAQLAAGGSVNTPVSQQNLNSRSQRMSAGGEGLAVSPSAPRPGPPGVSVSPPVSYTAPSDAAVQVLSPTSQQAMSDAQQQSMEGSQLPVTPGSMTGTAGSQNTPDVWHEGTPWWLQMYIEEQRQKHLHRATSLPAGRSLTVTAAARAALARARAAAAAKGASGSGGRGRQQSMDLPRGPRGSLDIRGYLRGKSLDLFGPSRGAQPDPASASGDTDSVSAGSQKSARRRGMSLDLPRQWLSTGVRDLRESFDLVKLELKGMRGSLDLGMRELTRGSLDLVRPGARGTNQDPTSPSAEAGDRKSAPTGRGRLSLDASRQWVANNFKGVMRNHSLDLRRQSSDVQEASRQQLDLSAAVLADEAAEGHVRADLLQLMQAAGAPSGAADAPAPQRGRSFEVWRSAGLKGSQQDLTAIAEHPSSASEHESASEQGHSQRTSVEGPAKPGRGRSFDLWRQGAAFGSQQDLAAIAEDSPDASEAQSERKSKGNILVTLLRRGSVDLFRRRSMQAPAPGEGRASTEQSQVTPPGRVSLEANRAAGRGRSIELRRQNSGQEQGSPAGAASQQLPAPRLSSDGRGQTRGTSFDLWRSAGVKGSQQDLTAIAEHPSSASEHESASEGGRDSLQLSQQPQQLRVPGRPRNSSFEVWRQAGGEGSYQDLTAIAEDPLPAKPKKKGAFAKVKSLLRRGSVELSRAPSRKSQDQGPAREAKQQPARLSIEYARQKGWLRNNSAELKPQTRSSQELAPAGAAAAAVAAGVGVGIQQAGMASQPQQPQTEQQGRPSLEAGRQGRSSLEAAKAWMSSSLWGPSRGKSMELRRQTSKQELEGGVASSSGTVTAQPAGQPEIQVLPGGSDRRQGRGKTSFELWRAAGTHGSQQDLAAIAEQGSGASDNGEGPAAVHGRGEAVQVPKERASGGGKLKNLLRRGSLELLKPAKATDEPDQGRSKSRGRSRPGRDQEAEQERTSPSKGFGLFKLFRQSSRNEQPKQPMPSTVHSAAAAQAVIISTSQPAQDRAQQQHLQQLPSSGEISSSQQLPSTTDSSVPSSQDLVVYATVQPHHAGGTGGHGHSVREATGAMAGGAGKQVQAVHTGLPADASVLKTLAGPSAVQPRAQWFA